MRGSWFKTNRTILIDTVVIHHTFSVEFWLMIWAVGSGDKVIFSKITNSYTNDNTDNLLEIIHNGTSLGA
jgi:hypothetical protein